MAFLDPVFNPILMPLVNKSPFLAVLILSFVISLIIVVIYKFFTNQDEMKRLKEEQKEYQIKMKGMRDKPEEMMKVQKEAMKKNMEYMKHSFKATLITFLPIILIFGWMSAHLAYEPIYPGESYSVTAVFAKGVIGDVELIVDQGSTLISDSKREIIDGQATWNLKSDAGEQVLIVKLGNDEQQKKVLITKELKVEEQITIYQNSDIEQIKINYNKLKPLGPNFTFPIFNWQPGWLGLYIIFSLVFSLGLRKVMKVY